jgi:chromosome partitioning protein
MFWQWLENFLHRWNGEWDAQKISIAVLAAALAAIAFKILVLALRWSWRQLQGVIEARRRLRHALWAVSEDSPGVWLSTLPSYPIDYQARMATSKPIMTVANLKGGVGKTTIAANLAAHYAYQGERVLFIDLDFQGSSSAMILPDHQSPDVSARLIEGGGKDILLREANPLRLEWLPPGLPVGWRPTACGIPADYSLARADNRVMVRWLLDVYGSDPRYGLAEALLDPNVQATYDRVIIDAPPRMVAGKVEALCASRHLLIPTILDRLSAEAVVRFANQLDQEKTLWPFLKIAGVTAVRCSGGLATLAERDTVSFLIQALERHVDRPQLFWHTAFIKQNQLLARAAGQYPVYGANSNDAQHTNLRNMFSELAAAITRGLEGERTHETWKAWLIDPNYGEAA